MKTGHITIKGDDNFNFTVEVELENGNLWLSKWEMAHLFNVFSQKIEGVLKSIFKDNLLREHEVTKIHKFTDKGKECIQTYYNLETLIFVSFRISSLEAKAFRKWVMTSISNHSKNNCKSNINYVFLSNENHKTLNTKTLN
jgi:hypothetical protein